MGLISTRANTVWRDGAPANPHFPVKPEIRELFGIVDAIAGATSESAADAAASAQAAEFYAAAAAAAIGQIVPSYLEFHHTGNGVTTSFAMAQAVQSGNEGSVLVAVAGVVQIGTYSCDGSVNLVFDTAPANGAEIHGVHIANSVALAIAPNDRAVVDDGRALSTTDRAERFPDFYDKATVYKDGSSNDGPGIEAAFDVGPVWTHANGIVRIESDTTIPAGTLTTIGSGQFFVASGKTLTINGVFNARMDSQVFILEDDTASVIGLDWVSPEMFGAVGDFDESRAADATYTTYTDNTDAINAAVRCVLGAGGSEGASRTPTVQCLDRAYGIDGIVLIQPALGAPFEFRGTGWVIAGSGTRFYSGDGTGCIMVTGGAPFSNPNAFVQFKLSSFSILTSADPAPVGLTIAGDGGVTDKVLSGLMSNIVENVFIGDFEIGYKIASVSKLRLKNCTGLSGAVYGVNCEITVTTGGSNTSDIAFEGCLFSQPTGGGTGGKAVYIHNDDVSGSAAASANVRGINFDDDCQLYGGSGGWSLYILGRASVSKAKNLGDIWTSPGTKLQGSGDLSSSGGVFVNAIDGAKVSSLNVINTQIEGFNGPAIQVQISTTGAVFGDVSDVKIIGNTFRYCLNQSIILDGVVGYVVTGNTQQYCGANAAPAAEHMYFRNSFGRVRDNITSHDDTLWPGLLRGVTITGSATKTTYLSGNAMGTSSAKTIEASATGLATDSTEQPSTLSLV